LVEVGGALGGIVEVFAAQEEIVAGIRGERGIDRLGPRDLGGRGAGDGAGAMASVRFKMSGRQPMALVTGRLPDYHSAGSGRWVAKEMFQMPAFWQVSMTSTIRW
jgi:hypothetical protein